MARAPLVQKAMHLQQTIRRDIMPGSQQNEVALLEQYDTDMGVLVEQLRNADPQASKRIQQQIDQKMQIYWKQI